MAATEGTNRPDSNTQAAAQTGAGQSPVVHLAQAATPPSHTTASIGNGNPNVVHVTPPGAGEREDITVLPGQTVVLDGIDIETAHVERVEGGLLITLADGGIIFLAGFVEAAGSGHPPVVEIPGLGDLAATQLLAASDSSTDNSLADIQPAAGPGGLGGVAHGGGADFETVNAGSIGSGLTPQGLLGPTDFTRTPPGPEFGLGSPQTNNTETPTTPTTPPPTITAGEAPGLAVDESNLTAATNNGIDGSTPNLALTSETTAFAGVFTASGGTTTYALSINGGNGTASGFTDAQTHQGIVLVDNGGTIEGHVGATDGQLAFTIAVDGSGNVTLTQDRAVVQADGTSPDTSEGASLASGLVHLTATVTDTGGTASASVDLNVSFLDDGPSISPADVEHAGFLVDESALPSGAQPSLAGTTDTENFAGAFNVHAGADGQQ
ncbi:MAG TPA: DUF5801 repeats-in-toxin domain-containing protein, partial [Alphaproteobacteria bacterium]|nr:DUF5801 repeats-in-toxin domain-containing protein [Alphaproteobacteria bacterium]